MFFYYMFVLCVAFQTLLTFSLKCIYVDHLAVGLPSNIFKHEHNLKGTHNKRQTQA